MGYRQLFSSNAYDALTFQVADWQAHVRSMGPVFLGNCPLGALAVAVLPERVGTSDLCGAFRRSAGREHYQHYQS